MTCHPPSSFCCDAFRARFERIGLYVQSQRTGLVYNRLEGPGALSSCPHCGAAIDPLVRCALCGEHVPLSEVWIDEARFLCDRHGREVSAERQSMREER